MPEFADGKDAPYDIDSHYSRSEKIKSDAPGVPQGILASRNSGLGEGGDAIEPNQSRVTSESAQKEHGGAFRTHPWRRFWARLFDTTVIILVLYLALLSVDSPSGVPTAEDKLNGSILLGPLVWAFVEPVFLSIWRTTPGKAMLGLTVESKNRSGLTYKEGLFRSIKVWGRGLGMNLPLVSWITLAVAFQNLANNGQTSWDREGGLSVGVAEIGVDNWIGYCVASVVVIVIFLGIAI